MSDGSWGPVDERQEQTSRELYDAAVGDEADLCNNNYNDLALLNMRLRMTIARALVEISEALQRTPLAETNGAQ